MNRFSFSLFLVMMIVCSGVEADVATFSVNGLRLGQNLERLLESYPEARVQNSPILDGGEAVFMSDGSAHGLNGQAVIIAGTRLDFGEKTLISRGQSRDAVIEQAANLGWKVDKEWEVPSDVARYYRSVLRLRPATESIVLVVFTSSDFTPNEPPTVSEVYLRTDTVTGPFGDE